MSMFMYISTYQCDFIFSQIQESTNIFYEIRNSVICLFICFGSTILIGKKHPRLLYNN